MFVKSNMILEFPFHFKLSFSYLIQSSKCNGSQMLTSLKFYFKALNTEHGWRNLYENACQHHKDFFFSKRNTILHKVYY